MEQDFIEENQDPIHAFYEYVLDDHRDIDGLCRYLDGKTTDDIYGEYQKWCEENQIRCELNRTFTRQFGKLLPVYVKKKVISIGGVKFNSYILDKRYGV